MKIKNITFTILTKVDLNKKIILFLLITFSVSGCSFDLKNKLIQNIDNEENIQIASIIDTSTGNSLIFDSMSLSGCDDQIYIPINLEWNTVVCDDFKNSTQPWRIEDFTEDEYSIDNKSITDGKYQWECIAKKDFTNVSGITLSEYDEFLLSTSAEVDNESDIEAKTTVGIYFYKSGDKFCAFKINPRDKLYKVDCYLNGDMIEILPVTNASEIHKYGPNQLTIIKRKQEFIIYINNIEVNHFSDISMSGGGYGLIAAMLGENTKAVIYFDNFVVLAP